MRKALELMKAFPECFSLKKIKQRLIIWQESSIKAREEKKTSAFGSQVCNEKRPRLKLQVIMLALD